MILDILMLNRITNKWTIWYPGWMRNMVINIDLSILLQVSTSMRLIKGTSSGPPSMMMGFHTPKSLKTSGLGTSPAEQTSKSTLEKPVNYIIRWHINTLWQCWIRPHLIRILTKCSSSIKTSWSWLESTSTMMPSQGRRCRMWRMRPWRPSGISHKLMLRSGICLSMGSWTKMTTWSGTCASELILAIWIVLYLTMKPNQIIKWTWPFTIPPAMTCHKYNLLFPMTVLW